MSTSNPLFLALEDGSIFRGLAFGADATIAGECVFNTSMTGYQEILTDPSYFGQIVTMTAVQIGNYGVNDADTRPPRRNARASSCANFSGREQLAQPVFARRLSPQVWHPGISEVDTRG